MEVLTKEDKAAIEDALKKAKMLREELAKAKRAGIDVTALEAQLNDAEAQLRNIHRVYFPTRTRTP